MSYRMQQGWGSQAIADIDANQRRAIESKQIKSAIAEYKETGVMPLMKAHQLERMATILFINCPNTSRDRRHRNRQQAQQKPCKRSDQRRRR